MKRLALGLLLLATACGPFRMGGREGEATVEFVNEWSSSATVYASLPGSIAVRMGDVLGGQTSRLRVPADLVSRGTGVVIAAELFGEGRRVQSPLIQFRAADTVKVRLSATGTSLFVVPP